VISTRQWTLPHDITLSCRSAGTQGRPVLMFLHGFPEAAFVWDPLLLHFSKPEHGGYHCIAPNMRGYEKSSAPHEPAAYRGKHLMQDVIALIADACADPNGQLDALVAHDWGGAVAWNLAAARPELMRKLVIINSPHPGTFLKALQSSPAQQAASAYMNFLIRPDAEVLLAQDDFRRLWALFEGMGACAGPHAWLTESVRQQYREIWQAGLTGPCNYYRASPLRPPRAEDPAAANITLAPEMLHVTLPTLVLWALADTALLPELLDGLSGYVPKLQLERREGATHWIVHEQPAWVATRLAAFLKQSRS
jgi:pimeloyl-ACP methyl ester carboxylesterase